MATNHKSMLVRAALGLAICSLPTAALAEAKLRFDLPAEPLADSLRAVGNRASVQVTFDPRAVAGKTAPALHGAYDPIDALRELTRDSGLTVRVAEGGSFAVEPSTPVQPIAPPTATAPNAATSIESAAQQAIVVTGTAVHGLVAPIGSPTVQVSQAEVKATGATNTVNLLASIPQMTAFGTAPVGQPKATQSFAIPSLRNLTTQQGDGTLFLFNGMRMVGGGFSTRPDPAVIPPGSLQRVEVVLGGGSAIYGSDAVAGTINFIMRRTLNGAEISGTYGGADHYHNYDVNAAVGKVWSSGNVMVTADLAGQSDLLGRYRSYYTDYLVPRGGKDFRSTSCAQPNITIGSTNYAYPNLAPNTTNICDPTDNTDLFPKERRRSALLSFNQTIVDGLEIGVDGYYSFRADDFASQPASARGKITSANPFFIAPPSLPGAKSETVNFNFADVFGEPAITPQRYRTWQVMPKLNWKIGRGWQATAIANFGRGQGVVHAPGLNNTVLTAALAGTAAATALDPYNLAMTAPAILSQIEDFDQYDKRIHKESQFRAVADGPLFTHPGGTVRLAVGVERNYESQWSISDAGPYGQEATFGGIPAAAGSRIDNAAFAELVIPVFGKGNAVPGFHKLSFDASLRYDHYSDFGPTTNPRIAANWEPIAGLNVRGDYSTAFVAPTLNSTTKPELAQILPTSPITPPGGSPNLPSVLLQGGNPNLKPETARVYDLGFDFSPVGLPDLHIGTTYYHIDFRNLIGGPNTSLLFTQAGWQPYFILNPTAAQLATFVGNLPHSPNVPLDFYGSPQIVIDSRTQNLGRVIASGIDYNLRYTFHTSVGDLTPALAGTHGLRLASSNPTGSPWLSLYSNGTTRDNFSASLTYNRGPVIGRITWDYLGGFPVTTVPNQTRVGSFQLVNLYVSYDLPKTGFTRGATIAVHVDNIFNRAPSYENVGGGIGNGSTFGRYASVTLSKKF